ncbi:Rhomboid family protein [Desulforamulus reducens MI-1]|uniref:Rhomboid family protein n=1 Tax=Desulforamulus reducens (strain ATCC BAA-1160 / DSM 100696 / MI-1) TaxID=349161 RepID=A4J8K1_DESRM|nr:rhomboid family intramembrane serine protease [Desulforamulus reducens]ABO51404.1 Rhomboid family protein [Desulforamulus reducens MI-1]
MIPLKDNIPSRRFPLVTIILILLNTFAWLYEQSLGPYMDNLIFALGVTPAEIFKYGLLGQFFFMTTAMFLHGSWMHFLGNMLYLWIFGDNVEDRMGKLRFLLFYLITGYSATLAHVFSDPTSTSPLIGASGAIAGVLGGYFVLFPHARVLTLIPIFVFIQIIHIPALYFLGFWFLLQVVNQTFSIQGAQSVAFLAHIGGFAAGALLVKFFQKYRY